MPQICIKCSMDGNFTYDPAVLRTQPGQSIEWSSDSGHFTVFFAERTPFTDQCIEFHGSPGQQVGGKTDELAVGAYHYAVALQPTGSNEIWIDAGCPVVIIGKRSTTRG